MSWMLFERRMSRVQEIRNSRRADPLEYLCSIWLSDGKRNHNKFNFRRMCPQCTLQEVLSCNFLLCIGGLLYVVARHRKRVTRRQDIPGLGLALLAANSPRLSQEKLAFVHEVPTHVRTTELGFLGLIPENLENFQIL